MGRSVLKHVVVLGVLAAVGFKSPFMGRELEWVLLVRLGGLVRIDDDLVEDLKTNHEQTEVGVAALKVLVVEETSIGDDSRKEEGLLYPRVVFLSLLGVVFKPDKVLNSWSDVIGKK